MTAREDQAQAVIDPVGVCMRRRLLLECGERRLGFELLALRSERARAAQTVDRLPSGRRCNPSRRVRWHAFVRPVVERGLERVLHRLFGAVEVAAPPDQ